MSDPIPTDSVYEELSGLRGGKWEYTVYLYSNERNHNCEFEMNDTVYSFDSNR